LTIPSSPKDNSSNQVLHLRFQKNPYSVVKDQSKTRLKF